MQLQIEEAVARGQLQKGAAVTLVSLLQVRGQLLLLLRLLRLQVQGAVQQMLELWKEVLLMLAVGQLCEWRVQWL